MLHEGAGAPMPHITYYYRRRLRSREVLAVLGIAAGAALGVFAVTFYIARMFAQRTPLLSPPRAGSGQAANRSWVPHAR